MGNKICLLTFIDVVALLVPDVVALLVPVLVVTVLLEVTLLLV